MTFDTDKNRNKELKRIAEALERIADALEDKGDDGGEEVTDNPTPIPPAPTVPLPIISGYYCMNCGQWVRTGTFHQCSSRAPYVPYKPTYFFCSKCGMRLTSGGYHICSGSGSPNISGSSSTWPGGYWNWNTNT